MNVLWEPRWLLVEPLFTGWQQHYKVAGKIWQGEPKRIVVDLDKLSCEPVEEPVFWQLRWTIPASEEGYSVLEKKILAFVERVLVPNQAMSLGVILDTTPLDFCQKIEGLQQPLFSCRTLLLDLWRTLLALFPEEILPLIEVEGEMKPSLFFELLAYELFHPFHLLIKSSVMERYPYSLPRFNLPQERRVRHALLLPPQGSPSWERLQEGLDYLEAYPFRCIAEEQLIYEWDGIEELVVIQEALSVQGQRKVNGYIAAGGQVIAL
ncbi:MAG: hypothetical protein ACKVOH_04980 [Chlamydiales bacterium]